MSRSAVVYWSGTGNTEAMAGAVLEGMESAGIKAALFNCTDFDASMLGSFDSIAFGCPAMGAEELEDFDFAPMFASLKEQLKGKRIGLFGSYGWGSGEWMRSWEEDCRKAGAILAADSVICSGRPDSESSEACRALGRALA